MGTTLLAGLAMASGAWAQALRRPRRLRPAPPRTWSELVVTGSRIPRPNLEQPTPVRCSRRQVIENAGPQSLGDIIAQLPAVGFTGTRARQLQQLRQRRGRQLDRPAQPRPVAHPGAGRRPAPRGRRHHTNAVDINSIPPALVDRVEVVTGGASAIYGSDAVSGVVNIILKKSFEGLQIDAQDGGYDDGFGAKYSASVTAGRTFLDDRLNIAVTGFYNKEDAASRRATSSRPPTTTARSPIPTDLTGPLDPTFYSSRTPMRNDGIPDSLFVPNVGSDLVTPNGVLLNANTFAPQFSFDAQGHLVADPHADRLQQLRLRASCRPTARTAISPTTSTRRSRRSRPRARTSAPTSTSRRTCTAILDAKFVQTDTSNIVQPSFSFGDFQLQPDNAFITPELRAAWPAPAPADYPFIGKFLNAGRDAGHPPPDLPRGGRPERRLRRHFAKVNWDGALNYGETDSHFVNDEPGDHRELRRRAGLGDRSEDRPAGLPDQRAVRAADRHRLRRDATPASCVPYNPFGRCRTARRRSPIRSAPSPPTTP